MHRYVAHIASSSWELPHIYNVLGIAKSVAVVTHFALRLLSSFIQYSHFSALLLNFIIQTLTHIERKMSCWRFFSREAKCLQSVPTNLRFHHIFNLMNYLYNRNVNGVDNSVFDTTAENFSKWFKSFFAPNVVTILFAIEWRIALFACVCAFIAHFESAYAKVLQYLKLAHIKSWEHNAWAMFNTI